MNAHDDWARWGNTWQRPQPPIDTSALQRRTQRKLRNMRIVVGLEVVVTLFATSQLVWMLLQPETTLRWQAWCGASFVLMAGLIAMEIHIRRGTWHASNGSNRDLLGLDKRRTATSIRLAKWNILGLLLLLAITLIAAAPYFDLQRWHDDARLRVIIAVQIAANTPVVVSALVICTWYVRRQRRRIARIDALLAEYDHGDSSLSEPVS